MGVSVLCTSLNPLLPKMFTFNAPRYFRTSCVQCYKTFYLIDLHILILC